LIESLCIFFTPNFRNIERIRQTWVKTVKFAGQTAVEPDYSKPIANARGIKSRLEKGLEIKMLLHVRNIARSAVKTAAIGVLGLNLSASAARADAGFRNWIENFHSAAAKSGISDATFRAAFAGVNDIDPEVLEKARVQPEFKSPVWDYFDNRVHERSIATGQAMAKKLKPWLDKIEQRFGVSRNILLAIWSMETNYGEILKRPDVVRSTVRSLATLAYADKRRAKYARTQLIASLKILQRGDVSVADLQGSWAGAMGHTQFIPTSFIAYGVDIDGNGRRDIWNSVPDALATSANLLAKNGWQSGRTWGYEVRLPAGKMPSGSLSLAKWQSLGVERANGKPFSSPSDSATLRLPDGRSGPAFLMLRNFSVIKRYNNAEKYALAVAVLADRIGGGGGFANDFNRPFTPLSIAEKEELQRSLAGLGYYDGNSDGNIGPATKASILAFQAAEGLTKDGYASMELLRHLRSK
jgi:membrane-bound lytic murein transglycosylase B